MPDVYGFDHLPRKGAMVLSCIWCPHIAAPGATEGSLARHARKHVRDAQAAAQASLREREVAQSAIAV